MSVVKYENQIPQVFNRLLDTELSPWFTKNFSSTNTNLPAVNIRETDDVYLIDFAAPGYQKDDFVIEVNNDVLTVSSEKKVEEVDKEGDFTKKEFSYESFSRSFNLPDLVETDKIKATYKNGILEIKIPKKEEAKPKPVKQIKVS